MIIILIKIFKSYITVMTLKNLFLGLSACLTLFPSVCLYVCFSLSVPFLGMFTHNTEMLIVWKCLVQDMSQWFWILSQAVVQSFGVLCRLCYFKGYSTHSHTFIMFYSSNTRRGNAMVVRSRMKLIFTYFFCERPTNTIFVKFILFVVMPMPSSKPSEDLQFWITSLVILLSSRSYII